MDYYIDAPGEHLEKLFRMAAEGKLCSDDTVYVTMDKPVDPKVLAIAELFECRIVFT